MTQQGVPPIQRPDGTLAQLVEHSVHIAGVTGSNPVRPTKRFRKTKTHRHRLICQSIAAVADITVTAIIWRYASAGRYSFLMQIGSSIRFAISALIMAQVAPCASAGPVSFAEGWSEQRLLLFSSNDYSFGETLDLLSNGSVSIAWTRVEQKEWDSSAASWTWDVERSVPATNLAKKGGDDRNLALYFIFVPDSMAPEFQDAGILSLIGNKDVRIIQYVWGGAENRGQIIPSPYGPPGQGVMIALRRAGAGGHSEDVDLAADYTRAFDGPKGALIGLAVSGDSDDTDSMIRASISNLNLR